MFLHLEHFELRSFLLEPFLSLCIFKTYAKKFLTISVFMRGSDASTGLRDKSASYKFRGDYVSPHES